MKTVLRYFDAAADSGLGENMTVTQVQQVAELKDKIVEISKEVFTTPQNSPEEKNAVRTWQCMVHDLIRLEHGPFDEENPLSIS